MATHLSHREVSTSPGRGRKAKQEMYIIIKTASQRFYIIRLFQSGKAEGAE